MANGLVSALENLHKRVLASARLKSSPGTRQSTTRTLQMNLIPLKGLTFNREFRLQSKFYRIGKLRDLTPLKVSSEGKGPRQLRSTRTGGSWVNPEKNNAGNSCINRPYTTKKAGPRNARKHSVFRIPTVQWEIEENN